MQADGVKLFAGREIVIFAAKAIGKSKWAIEDEFRIAVKIHRDGRGGYRHEPHRLSTAIDQAMPAVQRWCEETKRPPFEQLFFPSLLPDFRGAVAGENTHHLLVKMALRVQSAPWRDLHDVHSRLTFHAVEIEERRLAAGARPWRHRDVTDVFQTVTVNHRDVLACHPFEISGFVKCRHQSFYAFIL